MIKHSDSVYGKVLFEMGITKEIADDSLRILNENSELTIILDNPVISFVKKSTIIDKVFDKSISGFIKLMCGNRFISRYAEIFEAYENFLLESKDIGKASLSYAVMPEDKQLEKIKLMICKTYKYNDVLLSLKEDKTLIGGFVLDVGDYEYDRSLKGRLNGLQKKLLWR